MILNPPLPSVAHEKRNPEFGIREILAFGIRNPAYKIRNPTTFGMWNPESKDMESEIQPIWDVESGIDGHGIQNLQCGIQDPIQILIQILL